MTSETQAIKAIEVLKAQLVSVKDNGMFNSYDHVMICHGCGKFHAVRSSFISSSLSIGFRFADESQLYVPAYSCGGCSREVIRDAWKNGTKRLAYNAAASVLGAVLQPEPKPCALCGMVDITAHLPANGSHNLCAARASRGLPTPSLAKEVQS